MAFRLTEDEVTTATSGRLVQSAAPPQLTAVCTDTRHLQPNCLFVALEGDRFDAHQFIDQAARLGAAAALVERGKSFPAVPNHFGLIEVENTLTALGALANFHRRRFKIPIAAVTGSNGKTTTKEMIGSILAQRGPALKTEGNLNNEIGVPLTLFGLEDFHRSAVIEMGMSHFGEIARLTAMTEPDAGLITTVQEAHLEGVGSLEGVAKAKGELFLGLKADAVAVVNADSPLIVEQSRHASARQIRYGIESSSEVWLSKVVLSGAGEGLEIVLSHSGQAWPIRLSFVGRHNAHNAAGAFATGLALGFSPQSCVAGLEAARPYARRLSIRVGENGVTVLDDCYNANPASMAAALETVAELATRGRAVAVLGDMLELGADASAAHQQIGDLAAAKADLVAFLGPLSEQGYRAANRIGVRAAHFTEVAPLIEWLLPQLRPEDIVLVKASRGMRLERVVDQLCENKSSGVEAAH